MTGTLEALESRVAAAVSLIAALRAKAVSLEEEVSSLRASPTAPASEEPPPHPHPQLLEEVQRLRAERRVILERVRDLIREIDRVPW